MTWRLTFSPGWQKRVLPFLVFLALILGLLLTAQPVWSPPPDFDAYSYIKMAANPWVNSHVPEHHQQRILPPALVHLLCQGTGLSIPVSFRIIANIGFVFLALLLFRLLYRMSDRDAPMSASLALLLLISSWLMRYNLNVFYQLCDLFTYVFTLLILRSFMDRRFAGVLIFGILAILTRQNLIVLALLSALHFLAADVAGAIRPGVTRPGRAPCPTSASRTTSGFTWAGLRLHVLGGGLLASVVAALFMLCPHGGRGTLRTLTLDGRFLPRMFLDVSDLSLPFLVILVVHWRRMLSLLIRYYPFFVFALVTIYQPYSYYERTGHENAMRLALQGVWVLNLFTAFIVADHFRGQARTLRYWAVVLFPGVWVIVVAGERLTALFAPGLMGWIEPLKLSVAVLFALLVCQPCLRKLVSVRGDGAAAGADRT